MPVVLGEPDWPPWLGETNGDPKLLLRPCPDDSLRIWPVSVAINSANSKGADLLEPAAA
jgi:putative SOS response-associated peptidase YedK